MKDKKVVITINGVGGSGKDSLVENISKNKKSHGLFVRNLSSVDNIKEIARKCFDWDGEKDEKGRKLLSDLKFASSLYNNKPFKDFTKIIEITYCDVIFVHIREIEEIKKLKEWCGDKNGIEFTSLKVSRGDFENKNYRNSADNDAKKYYNYDYELKNSGNVLEWKQKTLNWFIQNIKRKFD